jgi:hypothetical protein
MLKILFSLLLLTNLLIFAYRDGQLAALFPDDREPARMGRQLNPERIVLLPKEGQKNKSLPAVGEAPAVVAPVPAPTPVANLAPAVVPAPALTPTPTPTPTLIPVAVPPQAPAPVVTSCSEVGSFDIAEAARFAKRIAVLGLSEAVTRRTVVEPARMMVYMPPQGSKEGAEKKAGELRRLGINDFFIMPDGDYQWGISLGVFRSEEAARAHLTQMGKRGVVTARLGPFSAGTSRIAFQFRGLDAAATKALVKIRADFAKQEMQACE